MGGQAEGWQLTASVTVYVPLGAHVKTRTWLRVSNRHGTFLFFCYRRPLLRKPYTPSVTAL